MRVLTCSRHFPAKHPRAGQPTWFVEKIWKSLWDDTPGSHIPFYPQWMNYDQAFPITGDLKESIHEHKPKGHTVRAGNRWKVGDMISLRVWSDKPYRSKQIEFAQVEVKKVWDIEINNRFGAASFEVIIGGNLYGQLHFGNDVDLNHEGLVRLAANDGLELDDFVEWFNIHPKKTGLRFRGQIICWDDKIDYVTNQQVSNEQD